jgi:predicted nucleotide-binding protein (sugar kinase/HSP70/actin superfamily)
VSPSGTRAEKKVSVRCGEKASNCWGIPAEISHLAADGVDNVISLQPFGCIANHIISKGIEKRIKRLYPNLNLLFLDFDSSTSEANVYNRLHFMVQNAKDEMSRNTIIRQQPVA